MAPDWTFNLLGHLKVTNSGLPGLVMPACNVSDPTSITSSSSLLTI